MSTVIRRTLASRATAALAKSVRATPLAYAAGAGEARATPLAHVTGAEEAPPGFEPFSVGALGYFPYYWQDPATLEFNEKTYRWISANLKANTAPLELDGLFTNQYIRALASISYELSTADRQALNAAKARTEEQQGALLRAWVSAGFDLPPGNQPIDGVIRTIANTWAAPPTNLTAMKTAHDLGALLNQTPAAGEAVLPALANYLEALGSDLSLMNAATMNTGYLDRALAAVQDPIAANGGIKTDDGQIRPAYRVATSVSDIVAGLNAGDKTSELKMSIERVSTNLYKVTPEGESPFNASARDFLTVTAGDGATEALQIASGSAPCQVEMTFSGVTPVYFGPVNFDMSSCRDWYWKTPIVNAIRNGTSDVTGFKFRPNPQIDFHAGGPFGFLTGVAISKHPVIAVKASGAGSMSIANQFDSLPSKKWGVSFLGTPVAEPGALTGYSRGTPARSPKRRSSTDATSESVTVSFDPPAETAAADPLQRTAFVHGVQADYPAT